MVGAYDDEAKLKRFATGLEVVTFEFENVSAKALEQLGKYTQVRPGPRALQIGQDRAQEKSLFTRLKIPTTCYEIINNQKDFEMAATKVGLPCVVKTTRLGYDGKGQAVISSLNDAPKAFATLGVGPFIVENKINFEREVSVLAVRALSGELKYYPLIENLHEGGILRRSISPAPKSVGTALEAKAFDYAKKVLEDLDYCGVLAIEFFVQDGELVANEIAPRVHNSGHWTIEGAVTSQFENHLRAVCGLPLGDTSTLGTATMHNIIGELPEISALLSQDKLHLHLYGKTAKPGRKLGHYTIM